MSCNGCRVLRKGCSESCILRPSLQWIQSPDAQANATLFVTKFFGRSDLLTFISAVPDHQKPALFQSLLFEACGRTVNPVNGVVGLLWSGKWHLCQAAVDTVLSGGTVSPIPGILAGNYTPGYDESSDTLCTDAWKVRDAYTISTNLNSSSARPEDDLIMSTTTPSFSAVGRGVRARGKRSVMSYNSEQSSVVTSFGGSGDDDEKAGNKEAKLLNLFE